jgi:hypothetical protein
MRFSDWKRNHDETEPVLGDVLRQISALGADDAHLLQRAYRVVGVEETAQGYRVIAERVAFDAEPCGHGTAWTFYNMPR